jgi:GNAT superfamily N-acetyltransferase
MSITVRSLTGAEVLPLLEDLAALRIAVFAEWPYLYHGDGGYETGYLREYAEAPGAVLVVAEDGGKVVGAATAAPMMHQKAAFRAPFEERGIDTTRLFYFGESVLLPDYRGRGLGHAFFDGREAQARAEGANAACFSAVIRADNHPARPAGYRPLDPFWTARGYRVMPGFTTELSWKEHGSPAEVTNTMQYWLRQW